MRLWSRDEHSHRSEQELPEIKRLDLAEVVLTLKSAGIGDLRKFRWLESPDEQGLAPRGGIAHGPWRVESRVRSSAPSDGPDRLKAELHTLQLHITPVGRKMLAFPVHPRYARMLLAAQEHGCVSQAALVAALTQGRDLLIRNAGKDVNSLTVKI